MSSSRFPKPNILRAWRGAGLFTLTLLAIEFFDEIVFGVREAAWPLIRNDLGLTYAQVGILLGVPGLASSAIEPVLGILGDVWRRRVLIVGGGLVFAAALLLAAAAPSFPVLLAAFILIYPASGAFVSLSQASLMDSNPARHEHLMARWTLAGSLGVVSGPLLLGLGVLLGLGWRGVLVMLVFAALGLSLLAARQPIANGKADQAAEPGLLAGGLRGALSTMRRAAVWRWLILLMFSDFMLDLLLGYLALYMVDVVGVTPALAGTAVAVWTGFGLLGDALLIPLLERVRGLTYLRLSALIMLILFPAFLLVPGMAGKLVLLGLMGLLNAGWYAILMGQLYSSLPGQSGTVMAIGSGIGVVESLVPALLGLLAQRFGLGLAMWVLILGPAALLVGLPRTAPAAK